MSDEDTDHETEEAGLDSHPNGSGEGSPEDPPKSRKRVRRPEKWKKTKRAKQRNSGEAYTSTSGKQVRAREMNNTPCGCSRRCYENVPADGRKKLFQGFWSTGNFDVQNAYLCGCIKIEAVGRHYTSHGRPSRRSYTRAYYVNNGAVSVRVCKVAFLRIHGVSNGRLGRALKAQQDAAGSPHTNRRGKHEPANKTKRDDIAKVKAHIKSFPHYRSHYSRKDNPHKQFLSPYLSVQMMYRLYKQKCEGDTTRAVSEWVYRKVFNESFNLSFGNPKSDTCKVCDSMKIKVDAESDSSRKSQLSLEWDLHKIKAQNSYQQLKEDAAYAKSHADTEMLTFDLEKSLPTPVLSTGIVYYKRQLWTYNQGIHDCSTDKACMHMWNESIASRGSHEVGSCILSHLKEMETTATKLVVYSDACGGQNRNIFLVCMWLYIVSNSEYPFTTVDHKFMVSGHSYLPNDRDFGHIELARKKNAHIFVPDDWERVVAEARRKNAFHVSKMETEDFVSLKPLKAAIVNRKVNTRNAKVEWLKIQWISVSKDKPLQFQYRYSLNTLESWKTVDLKRKSKGRPIDMGRIQLPQLRVGARPISEKKAADLLELLPYIPPAYHTFYRGLDGALADSDAENEAECLE